MCERKKPIYLVIALVAMAITLLVGLFTTSDLSTYLYIVLLIGFGLVTVVAMNGSLLSVPFVFYASFCLSLAFGPLILKSMGYLTYDYQMPLYIGLLLLFFVGYGFASFVFGKTSTEKLLLTTNELSLMKKCGLVLFVVGLVATLMYVISNRALLLSSGNMNDGRISSLSGNGLLVYIGKLMWLGVFVEYEADVLSDRNAGLWLKCQIAVAILLSLLIGFRSASVDAALVLLFMLNKRKRISNVALIILVLLIATGVIVYGAVRDSEFGMVAYSEKLLNELRVNSVNLNNIILTFPSRVDFQGGYTYLINLFMLAPGPDVDFTLWLKDAINLHFSGGGVTPTLFGELYINWGWLGTFIGTTLFGAACALLQRSYLTGNKVLISSLFLGYLRSMIMGGIANSMIVLLMYLICYFFICFYVKSRMKSLTSAQSLLCVEEHVSLLGIHNE